MEKGKKKHWNNKFSGKYKLIMTDYMNIDNVLELKYQWNEL